MPTPRDPRWVLLAETGEYSILGRHREPGEEDIVAAETALARAGRSGWLAVMSHSAHSRVVPEFVMVRPLRDPQTSFADAVQAFRRHAGRSPAVGSSGTT
jgi:hypothetical protein